MFLSCLNSHSEEQRKCKCFGRTVALKGIMITTAKIETFKRKEYLFLYPSVHCNVRHKFTFYMHSRYLRFQYLVFLSSMIYYNIHS